MSEIMTEIAERRSYRALAAQPVPRADIELMVRAGHLAPSCFNHQPWRFVVMDDRAVLARLHTMLGASNTWMRRSPVVIALTSQRDLDCKSSDNRDYFMFDCGMATGLLMLQAWRMGYVAHPVAGYNPVKVKALLGIPESYVLITLVNIGRKGEDLALLDAEQQERETGARIRRPLGEVLSWNRFEPLTGPGSPA